MVKYGISLGVLLLALGSPRLYAAKEIALLDSDIYTKAFFQENYPNPNEYMRYFLGWKYVLECENNGQHKNNYIILKDYQLTPGNLATVKILILSNTIRLDSNQVKIIDTWVRKGGRLIATFGSGYLGFASSLDEDTELKGKTFGLHQLWHDPMSKIYGSDLIGAYVLWTKITKSSGPTSIFSVGNQLPYGLAGQFLTHQTDSDRSAVAEFILSDPSWTKKQTAIVNTKASKGLVVYFAFAPEYIVTWEFVEVGKENDWSLNPSCTPITPPSWWTSWPFPMLDPLQRPYNPPLPYPPPDSTDLKRLMKRAIDYMLNP